MENLTPDERGLDRGARLFSYLVDAANRGAALGISYGDFMAYLHNAGSFREFAGRSYRPSDTADVLAAADAITRRAGGRKRVSRLSTAIDAGMDTFIWRGTGNFGRSEDAWQRSMIPYTRPEWLTVFPDGARELVTIRGLDEKVASLAASSAERAQSIPASQAMENAGTPPAAGKLPLSLQLEGLRTRLVQGLVALDNQTAGRPVGTRVDIGEILVRLRIPRYLSALMRTITEMRNAGVYESKTLSPAESTAVEAAWAAIEEWASSRGLKI